MARLELVDLRKRYGGVTAVDGISLTVDHGEIVSLLGPSGCGKTTTLNMLAGFLTPDEGQILVDGKPVHDLPPEREEAAMKPDEQKRIQSELIAARDRQASSGTPPQAQRTR